jgi:hypothetical protein
MDGYTSKELSSTDLPRFPEKGDRCARCGTIVPVFLDLTEDELTELRELALVSKVEATKRVQVMSGCNARWAKIWVAHPNGAEKHRFSGPPCPFCGEPLPNERSKQCLSCSRKWHDNT